MNLMSMLVIQVSNRHYVLLDFFMLFFSCLLVPVTLAQRDSLYRFLQPEHVSWSQRNISVTGDFDLALINMFRNSTYDPSGLNYATTTEVPIHGTIEIVWSCSMHARHIDIRL